MFVRKKITIPRKELYKTLFGEHCYLYRITIKIMERATALIGGCELPQTYAILLVFCCKAIINAKL